MQTRPKSFLSKLTIRPASHGGATWKIPGSALESASKGAVGNWGAPESAREGQAVLELGTKKAWEWQCSSERSREQFRTI